MVLKDVFMTMICTINLCTLDKTSCIFGEWKGPTAAGKEIEEKMKNQKYAVVFNQIFAVLLSLCKNCKTKIIISL